MATPPSAAPTARSVDHVAEDSALAVSSSVPLVMLGIEALRAPTASSTDQVAADRALAVSSSRGLVMLGSEALRAGTKTAPITIWTATSP